MTATDVAAHWHEHFSGEAGDTDQTLNDQAVCFFQVAAGANLGSLVVGRKGAPTRFEFNAKALQGFVEGAASIVQSDEAIVQPSADVAKLSIGTAPAPPTMVIPTTQSVDSKISTVDSVRARRVFITHGKDTSFIEPIKKLLAFGELQAVVSTEKQTVSQPVPDKVMSDMRSCGAAIIHVHDEVRLIDSSATEHIVLNPNVLIEIGAAMALYGRRFILIVKEGVKLPSNLQGLYEVRYPGEQLDGNATIKLLEAINDIKNHPVPE